MSEARPRYSKEDAVRKGQEIFDRDVFANLDSEDPNHFVAIDIESGDYEVGSDELEVIDHLRARRPDAQVWMRRVGFPWTHRFRMLRRRTGSSFLTATAEGEC